MKRIGSLFLAVVLAALILAPAALAEGATFVVTGPETLPKAGETFEVTVSLTGNPGFCGVGVKLAYNEAEMRCISAEAGDLTRTISGVTSKKGVAAGYISLRPISGDGEIAVFTFEALRDAPKLGLDLYDVNFLGEGDEPLPYMVRVEETFSAPAPEAPGTNPVTVNPPAEEPPAEEKPDISFSDLKDNWAKPYILKAAEKGIFGGYEDGSFRPDNPITRAQFVTVLWRMKGSPAPAAPCPFADMAGKNEDYRMAVSWGYEQGFVSGRSADTFDPDGTLTRQEAMKLLFGLSGGAAGMELMFYSAYDSSFADSDAISGWARPGMYWAVYHELISGVGGGRLDPRGVITRSQVAKILVIYDEKSI